jgi:hypothetical protein
VRFRVRVRPAVVLEKVCVGEVRVRACAPAPMCVCKHAQMRRECERNMLMNTCMHAWMHGCMDA